MFIHGVFTFSTPKLQILTLFMYAYNSLKCTDSCLTKGCTLAQFIYSFYSVVLLRDGLYKVQIGAFTSKENAESLATKARNAGFDAIVFIE
jgi:hypothetical protein